MSGAQLAQAVTDAADQLAGWEPEDFGDVFGTLAALADMLGAVAEAISIVAITAEESRAVDPAAVAAAEEAVAWTAAAASGLGSCYGQWAFLRGAGTRWLPRGARDMTT